MPPRSAACYSGFVQRILKACRQRLETLARQFGARKPERAVALWMEKARQQSRDQGLPLSQVLVLLDAQLQARWRRYQWRRQGRPLPPTGTWLLYCDAGLGGLARWLWAAGQRAVWCRETDDTRLIQKALRAGAVLLTPDSLLLERRIIRTGRLPTLWVPPTLRVPDQLKLVFEQLALRVAQPRCMRCGGALVPVAKAAVADRIPPRTALWLDQYFLCEDCDGLFWRGTHWQRIRRQLQALGLPGAAEI